jgi:hypothetical protein
MDSQQLVDVYLGATSWLGFAAVELLKQHKEVLDAKFLLALAKKEGVDERILEARLNPYRVLTLETNLHIAIGRVELFTDFIDDNIPEVVGVAARQRTEKREELLPFYYRSLPGAE